MARWPASGSHCLVLLGTLLLSAVGCDAGESSFSLPSFDAGVPGAEYQGVCSGWATRECAYEAACSPGLFMQWADATQCAARRTIDCELRSADPAIAFDPTVVSSCQFPTDCTAAYPGLCLPLGPGKSGDPCQWDEDCASGACDLVTNGPCGSCASLLTCEPVCTGDATCVVDEDGGTSCLVPPTVGEACTGPDYVCGSNSACQIDQSGSGVCVPLVGIGQPCSDGAGGAECYDPDVNTFCDVTQHCRAYQPASYGEPCGVVGGLSAYECIGWGTCEYAATSICVPPADDGSLCDDQQGLGCIPPARCIDHICLFPSAAMCSP